MFLRRLAFLFSIVGVVVVALVAQLARLTVAEGAVHRRDAEARLDRRTFLATYRGRILDRHGRVLAADRPCYDVAVEYEFLSGAWAVREATSDARLALGRTTWAEMSPEAREAEIEARLPAIDARVDAILELLCSRGGIDQQELDHRLDEIKRRVHRRAVAVWDRQREMEVSRHGDEDAFTARPIREQRRAHVVLEKVPDAVAFEFSRIEDELPGTLVVQESTRREYPLETLDVTLDRSTLPRPVRSSEPLTVRVDGVADHILGSLRSSIFAGDVARRPFLDPETGKVTDLGGYRPVNDAVGQSGIERSCEETLRGRRGMVETRLDTGTETRIEPEPGEDVRLTIDIALQARIQALLQPEVGLATVQQWHRGWTPDGEPKPGTLPLGWHLNAAAVVLDVDSGEVLAAVSSPSAADGRAMTPERRSIDHPDVNRALESPYEPGSILKPLVFLSAVTEGVVPIDRTVTCTGHYFPSNRSTCRCWIFREQYGFTNHSIQVDGPLDVVQALARSCNIYFYTVADRMGARRLVDWLRQFGLGSPLDAGVLAEQWNEVEGESERMVGEGGGSLPSEGAVTALEEARARSTMVMLGIGQGPMTWTPLQAANAYATMARSGAVRDATLLMRDPRRDAVRRSGDLGLDPRAVAMVMRGLRESVEESYGTGHHIRYEDRTVDPIIDAEGVIVWAKTGTAQTTARRLDTDGDGTPDEMVRGLDHAWFVGLVGSESERRPRYAVAVILELGGSGGRVAGPVANQIIHQLQALGYLDRTAGDGGST